jgi:glycolate oxidase
MTSLQMPKVDKQTLSNKDKINSDLSKILKSENILSHEDEIRPYETDALAAYKQKPLLVVLPETVEQVSKILQYCNANKIKVVPRGAGTGLSGEHFL